MPRRDDTETTSAHPHISLSTVQFCIFTLHCTAPFARPPLAPTRNPQLPVIVFQGCRLIKLRSCASSEVVEGCFLPPLLAPAKLPAVFYASTIVAFRISKTTAEPQSIPPKQELSLEILLFHCPPTPIATFTNPIPNLKCFGCENSRREADREKPALRGDGIPTVDRAQRAARARADFDCSP